MMPMVDVLTPPSPQSTCSCCIGSRRLSTGGCAPSPVSPSPTKKVTPSPITPPSVPDVCASITNKHSCKKSRSAGCKWKSQAKLVTRGRTVIQSPARVVKEESRQRNYSSRRIEFILLYSQSVLKKLSFVRPNQV